MTNEMPEEIWAYETQDNDRLWMEPVYVEVTKIEVVHGESVKYVRADKYEALQAELLRLQKTVEGAQGSTPSQQKGGCDYMSLSDAVKYWQKYVSIEMRNPCGLNDDAKAALTLLRNLKPRSVDLDALKKPCTETSYFTDICPYDHGWNDCLNHLRETGVI